MISWNISCESEFAVEYGIAWDYWNKDFTVIGISECGSICRLDSFPSGLFIMETFSSYEDALTWYDNAKPQPPEGEYFYRIVRKKKCSNS